MSAPPPLADQLDPGHLGHQIGCGSLEADLERIAAAVAQPLRWRATPAALEALLSTCSESSLLARWQEALTVIDDHWRRLAAGALPLRVEPAWRIRWISRLRRLRQRLR